MTLLSRAVRISLPVALPVALLLSSPATRADATPPADLDAAFLQSTRAMAGELVSRLGQTLKNAIANDGLVAAVSVCKEVAPAIAAELSATHQASVKRVGTRARNPATGVPNGWQKEALTQFEQRLAKGDKPAELEYWQVADKGNGQRELRYAKAILVQPMCVSCHGAREDIPAPLAEKLRLEYPQDEATGYSVGKLRGAVVVTRPM